MTLSEAFSLRDAFISDAAHQMRNPVAAIQAQAEAAVTAPNEAELRRRVAELAETARRAGRLTNQLLSMERIRGRKLRLAVGQTDLAELAELASARARGFAERVLRRDVTVSFTQTGLPRSLEADGVWLGEMMENILDNALIYGCPPGRAAVVVQLAFETGAIVFSVTDTGPGIPVALRERVFDRFSGYRMLMMAVAGWALPSCKTWPRCMASLPADRPCGGSKDRSVTAGGIAGGAEMMGAAGG